MALASCIITLYSLINVIFFIHILKDFIEYFSLFAKKKIEKKRKKVKSNIDFNFKMPPRTPLIMNPIWEDYDVLWI